MNRHEGKAFIAGIVLGAVLFGVGGLLAQSMGTPDGSRNFIFQNQMRRQQQEMLEQQRQMQNQLNEMRQPC